MVVHENLPVSLGLVAAILLVSCGFTAGRAFDRGTKLYEKGQYAEASIEFRRAIQKDPKFGEAYLKLGLTELRQANPQVQPTHCDMQWRSARSRGT